MTAHDPARVRWGAVAAFVLLACGLAWLVALPLWVDGGLANPLAAVLLPVLMWTPAIATLVVVFALQYPARGERLRMLGIWPMRPVRRVIWLIVAGWLVPPVLVALSVAVAAAFGWVRLDFTFSLFAAAIAKTLPAGAPMPPVELLVMSQLLSIPIGAVINSFFAFGEEVGWRGWLVPALRPLGTWPMLLLTGVIWGVWHSPVILLGYNFGRLDVTGVLFMIGGCVAWGILLGWLRLRSASVWPAVIAHGSLNASAALVVIVAATQPDMALAGPLGAAGWIVCLAVTVALVLAGQFRRQPELASTTP